MSGHPAKIPVMFDRVLRPEWLDYALDQYSLTSEKKELDERLKVYLSEEITSPTSLRKTISQLQRTVGYLSAISREELMMAHAQMNEMAPSQRTQMRIDLLVKANPFVADCVHAMQKLALIGKKEIVATELYDRLSERYGDRGTIPRRVRYVFSTLQYFGVIENRRGTWILVDGQGVW